MGHCQKRKKFISIAIDGPSGAGKSSVAKLIAEKFGISYVDTGAIYRTVGYAAYINGIDPSDRSAISDMLGSIKVDVRYIDGRQEMFLDGTALGEKIREHIISDYASKASSIPEVRDFLLDTQRSIARNNSVIMDGRDIGTVILPDADVKIYLYASVESRALRRYRELTERGEIANYDTVYRDIEERDHRDMTRDIAPLKQADDAAALDNSDLDLQQTLDAASEIILKKLPWLREANK